MVNVSCSVLCQFFATPWTIAHQAPLSMGFSRQEYWSGCHSLLQGIFLIQKWNPGLLNCRQILYLLSYQGSPRSYKGLVRHFFFFFFNTFSFYSEWDGLVLSGFPGDSVVKNPAAVRISGSGRSPGQGNGNHSSIVAWRIPRTEEPVGLQSSGLRKSQIRLRD